MRYSQLLLATFILSPTLYALEQRLEFRHLEPQGIGFNEGYTTGDYSILHLGGRLDALVNLRGHAFNNGEWGANAGLGVRYSLKDEKYVVGGNLYYDARQDKHLFTNQVGGGLEFLTRSFDLRANAYVPVGEASHVGKGHFDHFVGHSYTVRRNITAALPCLEFEVGAPLAWNFYIAAAPYYLFPREVHGLSLGHAFGGKARASVELGNYFVLSAGISYDTVFRTRAQGVIALKIPLGPIEPKVRTQGKKERDLRHLPIYRNEIIPYETKKRRARHGEEKENLFLGNLVFVNNLFTGEGDGSFEAPFRSLKDAEAHSEPGDVIYVFAGDGSARHMAEGIALKANQRLASSAAPLTLGDVTIPPLTPGKKPIITNIHRDQPIIANLSQGILDGFIIEPWERYAWGSDHPTTDWSFSDWGFQADAGDDFSSVGSIIDDLDVQDLVGFPDGPEENAPSPSHALPAED